MEKRASLAPFAVVIVLAFVLQVGLVAADMRPTPVKVAKQFVSSFLLLDPAAADYVCSDLAPSEEADPIGDAIYQRTHEARLRGLPPSFMRQMLYDTHVATEQADDQTVTVHLTGTSRVCINPVFATVARIFHIGEEYPFEATLTLVKQEGTWKVCGTPFGLGQEEEQEE